MVVEALATANVVLPTILPSKVRTTIWIFSEVVLVLVQ